MARYVLPPCTKEHWPPWPPPLPRLSPLPPLPPLHVDPELWPPLPPTWIESVSPGWTAAPIPSVLTWALMVTPGLAPPPPLPPPFCPAPPWATMLMLAVPAGIVNVSDPTPVNDWLTTRYAGLSGQLVAAAGVELVSTVAAAVVPPTSAMAA